MSPDRVVVLAGILFGAAFFGSLVREPAASSAATEKRRNARDEAEEHTIWFRVSAWGRQAEVAAEYLAKGRQVYVEGRLRLEQYTDREGNPRTSAEVNASEIHFLCQRVDVTAEASDMTEESGQGDEELEKDEASKPTSSRSGKKSGSKRVPAKEAAGIVDDV